ncbi:cathepsin O isoform X1 [Balaenoptera ricei]|uniref:cathepsin O isoform X1 n=1 Tax=Balaenoptera ricei TaxID=2746895 RepID=UPI0028BDCE53|nr:cathepsin O isoform X1 [Balaenoptera ricei]
MKVKLNSAAACIFPSGTKRGGRRGLTQQVRSRDSGAVTPVRRRPSGSLPAAGGDPGARAPARAPRPAQREAAVRGRRTPISGRRGRRGVTVSAPRPARGPQAPDPPAAGARDRKGERAMELRRLWLLCCCCGCCPGAAPAPPSGRNPPAAFRESLNRHRQLNSLFPGENSTAVYGINQFSYLFPEEFKAIYLRSRPSSFPRFLAGTHTSISNLSLPLRFDWRDKHVVTPVRNQQTCGGCWAFTVVGAVESACAIAGQPLEALSVQQVLDCSYSNHGCNGGSPLNALNWLSKMQVKLVRDSEYPFKAQNGLCRYFSDSHFGFSIKGYSAYDFRDHEDEMAKALLTLGPLIVVVDAVSWQDYLGGIIQHHCSSGEANHAVLVTGFDKTGSTPYWIVRNSWGTSWGIDGCVHVKMGGNICGIAESVSAVFV